MLNRSVTEIANGQVVTECVYSGQKQYLQASAVTMVTSRVGNDELWNELITREGEWASHGVQSIKLIGDAESPAPIAWATYAGHRYARELDMPDIGDVVFDASIRQCGAGSGHWRIDCRSIAAIISVAQLG